MEFQWQIDLGKTYHIDDITVIGRRR